MLPIVYVELTNMINKQLEQIVKDLEKENSENQYWEVAIYLIDGEDSLNFIVDKEHFKYEIDDEWLFVRWNGGDDSVIIYSHLVKIDRIEYITSEV